MKPDNTHAKSSRHASLPVKIGAGIAIAVGALSLIWIGNEKGQSQSAGGAPMTSHRAAGQFRYVVGSPGPGQEAPAIRLAASTGGEFDLATQRGKTVLLYFQEGLMCQPCWDQIAEIEKHIGEFRALGIDTVVSVTTDPVDLIARKMKDMRLTTAVLSDPNLSVSKAYHANDFGMMGRSRDGHTFILVGPDGKIRWRADYGGAPDYTMFLPATSLVSHIRESLATADR